MKRTDRRTRAESRCKDEHLGVDDNFFFERNDSE